MNERLIWGNEQEALIWEAYNALSDLGFKMDYNEFVNWLKLKLGEQNESTKK